ncbi:hypothetical protein C6503_02620 [Candidatus Poribacteria bacterium]|nr:MAG: hypothetical protein C6503_02620 [Candidatus Poribacteria bacterium]
MKIEFFDGVSHTDALPEYHPGQSEVGKIELLDVVALTHDMPEYNLWRGQVGTVVEILSNGDAFEVEFSDGDGQMYQCLSFLASQLMVLHHDLIQKTAASSCEELQQLKVYDQLIPWSLKFLYPNIT